MLDDLEALVVVHREIGGVVCWAAWHEAQDVYLCCEDEETAKKVADFLNRNDVIVMATCDCPEEE